MSVIIAHQIIKIIVKLITVLRERFYSFRKAASASE
jgi:hypothetical protein